jgi:hypothetical protein
MSTFANVGASLLASMGSREQARSHTRKSPAFTCKFLVSAFSLVEVVIAVGIFTVAVTVMLALLPALVRQAGSSADTLTALRLPDPIRLELQRVAVAGGFDALATQARPMGTPLPATLTLVASRTVTQVQSLDYQPPATGRIVEEEQYYLVEAWQFTQPPLAFDPAGAGLALHIRVSWPYRNPGAATVTPPGEREQVTFNLTLSR